MDGGYITALRTAAASGVSAKYLAVKDARILGIVGAGVQGRYHLESLKEVLPEIKEINVYDTNESVLSEFMAHAKELGFVSVISYRSAREVIEGADIVVTATGHLEERVYKDSWVKKSALVLPVHTRGWEKSMLANADKFIVDDWQQFNNALGGADGYYAPLPELYAELGQIVVGEKPGRVNSAERIVNINFGMAIHDVLMATRVLERAKAKGLGLMLSLLE
jgi:ornithine cyclodeaminase/alanine dehydrogenase